MLLCFVCQFVLVMSISELLLTDAFLPLFTEEVSVMILFGRFICATILHLSLIDEVTRGIINLKFCVNHYYMFTNLNIACTVCLL